jgi:hypothetical protein
VTVTTVGYGDVAPKATEDRIIAIIVMTTDVAFTPLAKGSGDYQRRTRL